MHLVTVVLSFTLCFKVTGICSPPAAVKSQSAENTLQLRCEKLVKNYSQFLNVRSGSKYVYEEIEKANFFLYFNFIGV